MNKMKYAIMSNDTVIGKVYIHPEMGRTVCFEGSIRFDEVIKVYEYDEVNSWKQISETSVLDFFKELVPKEY